MVVPRHNLAVHTLSLLAILACGCQTRVQSGGEAGPSVHERSLRRFAAAHLTKPSDSAAAAALLPPWILLKEPGANGRAGERVGDTPSRAVEAGPTTLYFQPGTITIHGTAHAQVTYLWSGAGTALWQGVRMTLDTAGKAVIWEVLRDSSGSKHIFVAESLEQAALKEHGETLEGRRFAVERPRQAAPGMKVVRAIEEGPVPMGPMVYVDEEGNVTTVICRCMPAQADNLTGTSFYEVEPADLVLASWKQRHGKELWPQVPLQDWLRLPGQF